MSEKTCLVLHRKSANEPEVKAAVRAVQKEGIDLRVLVPFDKSEKPRVVAEALERGADRVVAGGGDGTINAVASALVDRAGKKPKTTLGILPLGTANDFARGCGLPVNDLTECLRIACTRKGRAIDVGVVNKRYFVNVASAGFGAEITAMTPVDLKKALGGAAYTLMGLVKAFQLSPYSVQLRVPSETPLDGEMLFMAVANNRFAGGGFEVAPKAKLDDGLLDLVALRQGDGFSPARLAQELEDPMNPENQHLYYRQLPSFEIASETKLHSNLDGEAVHRKRYRFAVRKKYLRVAF